MILFPNAKINLGLNIVSKRPDSYHNLETLFYPISICDALEVVPANRKEGYTIQISGIEVDGDPQNNLVIKAWEVLNALYPLPAIDIFLHKAIPFGAGLGGGSADAAFMLRLLRDLFKLPLQDGELQLLAAQIGADCPFFIENRPMLAYGIGNEFAPTELSLTGYQLVLIKPNIHVSTAEAYALVQPAPASIPLSEVVEMPIERWRELLINDFEASVFAKYPAIAEIKELLYSAGAIYASMSGSGSSVYGIFPKGETPQFEVANCYVWKGVLR